MTQAMQAQSPAQPLDAAGARHFAAGLKQLIEQLAGVLQEETTAVRAGRLREAAAFEARKSELAGRYFGAAVRLKAHAREIARLAPDALRDIKSATAGLQPMMQMNLTVLATAHAVAEGLVRGVAEEVAKQSAPTTYGRYGRPTAPAARKAEPVALVRTL